MAERVIVPLAVACSASPSLTPKGIGVIWLRRIIGFGYVCLLLIMVALMAALFRAEPEKVDSRVFELTPEQLEELPFEDKLGRPYKKEWWRQSNERDGATVK